MKKCFVLLPLMVMGGCSSFDSALDKVERSYNQYQFNNNLEKSQYWTLEARALLAEGKHKEAKLLLDKAFTRFQDHVALHEIYQNYYAATGNKKMAAIAQARAKNLKIRSEKVNFKGRIAMEKYDAYETANDLFSLSLIYWSKNTSALTNMATLAYVTYDYELGIACLQQLNALGHKTPESTMLAYLFAERQNDRQAMAHAKMEMSVLFKESPQYAFISNGQSTLQS